MSVRLENIHTDVSQSYVSFLNKPQRSRSDGDSIHSVSSVRSAIAGMSSLWTSIGLGSKDSVSKSEKAKAALDADLKYLYSAFTKIPCLRLAPDHRACLIRGYEEFPFDTAVPLHSFKNLSALEIIDIDFRAFFGWDRLSEQLRSLTLKRANLEDPGDLLTGIVLDDIDKRRRRSSKSQPSPVFGVSGASSHPVLKPESADSMSAPGSPVAESALGQGTSPQAPAMVRGASEGTKGRTRATSVSPSRPVNLKHSAYRPRRGTTSRLRRTGSGSSNSTELSGNRNSSSSNLLSGFLPPTKWRFLRHLCLADNSLTSVTATGLAPVANTLHSLDLSTNLFTDVPDGLATLVALRALNLSNCMIESLHSLSRNPLPAITAFNLRGNRLRSLAGIERLLSLERLDLRDNNLSDPTEIARLTCLPEIREIWVSGNPFVRTHSGYRVVIFNLFRRTPGYMEDIIIDGSGPGYAERKQLADRAAEPEGAPVKRPIAADQSSVVLKPSQTVVRGDSPLKSSKDQGQRQEQLASSNPDADSTRRNKTHRRKIDLPGQVDETGQGADIAPVPSGQAIHLPTDPTVSSPNSQKKRTGLTTGTKDRGHRTSSSSQPRTTKVPTALQGLDWDLEGELYRQKLEALRREVGNGWLTVLGDRNWDNTQADIHMRHTGTSLDSPGPMPLSRTSSQAIVSGAGTAG